MSDPAGAAFGALLTAAARHNHIQEPAPSQEGGFKIVRLRMRQPPETLDLACYETLPPDPSPVFQPSGPSSFTWRMPPAPSAALSPPFTTPKAVRQFNEKSVDCLYWSKHKVLTSMMDGFAHTLVAQLDKVEKKSLASLSKADLLSAVVKEERPCTSSGTLKTIADHKVLDELISIVCGMHTKCVNHAAEGRFRSQQKPSV